MKKRDIYFILLMVFVVAFLGFMSRIRRFKRIPADAYHKELNAPDDCVQCHQHPKGWSMPSPPPPDLTIPVARRRILHGRAFQ